MKKIKTNGSWYQTIELLIKKSKINCNQSLAQITQQIKKYLQNQFIDMWKQTLFDDKRSANGNKLRNYRTYKNTFKREEYLDIKSVAVRGALSRLRLSAHNLHIETGRYNCTSDRKPPEDRLCYYCTLNVCEDEYHFVMQCSLYDSIRADLFSYVSQQYNCFKYYNDQQKFIWLMANVDIHKLS